VQSIRWLQERTCCWGGPLGWEVLSATPQLCRRRDGNSFQNAFLICFRCPYKNRTCGVEHNAVAVVLLAFFYGWTWRRKQTVSRLCECAYKVSVFRALVISFTVSNNFYSNVVSLTITEGSYFLHLPRRVSLCTRANSADKSVSCLPILSCVASSRTWHYSDVFWHHSWKYTDAKHNGVDGRGN
jgi:hypothetical protein